jgi:DNA adenine methylase
MTALTVPLSEAPVTRPALRWHGGKWRLAPWIISHFPKHRIYVEPYGGAMSVLIRKPRCYAEVYNDLDEAVVNLFRVLRCSSDGPELHGLLSLTPFSRSEFKQAYQAHDNPVEAARRLIVRSFMGFGSNGHNRVTGFRSNSNRSGTTPAHDWVNYAEALPKLIDRLQGVVIESSPAIEVMAQHDGPETLHYVDPPYVFETRDNLSKDYAHEMTDDDHAELAEFLRTLKGFVILSGYHNRIYDEVLSNWHTVERAALADGARKRTEVLWHNQRAYDATHKGSLI